MASASNKRRRRAAKRATQRRLEEVALYTRGESNAPVRFAHEQHATVRCPDCETREALSNEGRPMRYDSDREPLRPVSRRVPRAPHRSRGCETCGGTGEIDNPEGARDPYSVITPEVAAAITHLRRQQTRAAPPK